MILQKEKHEYMTSYWSIDHGLFASFYAENDQYCRHYVFVILLVHILKLPFPLIETIFTSSQLRYLLAHMFCLDPSTRMLSDMPRIQGALH